MRPSAVNGPLRRVATVVCCYLAFAIASAALTPMIVTKAPAIAFWGIGAIVVFAIVARTVAGIFPASRALTKALGGALVALALVTAVAFSAFVLMVNIWEAFGLGH